MKFSAEQILKFILDRYGKRCPLGIYILEYFMAQNLVAITESAGRLTGVIIFRKTKLKDYDDRERMAHDKRGDCAFVVELCADSKKDIALLEFQMRKRLGKVKHLGMHRKGRVYFYDYEKFMKKLLGKDRL